MGKDTFLIRRRRYVTEMVFRQLSKKRKLFTERIDQSDEKRYKSFAKRYKRIGKLFDRRGKIFIGESSLERHLRRKKIF